MVSSTGIFVKMNSASYETSSYSSKLLKFFIKSGKVNVLLVVNSFLAKGLATAS